MTEENKNINSQEETELYEIGFHIIPTVSPEEIDAETQKIKDVLDAGGAFLVNDEALPKLNPLAYEVSKKVDNKKQSFDKAYFGWIKFEAPTEQISEIKSKIDELPNILRFMIVKTVRSGKMVAKKPLIRKQTKIEPKFVAKKEEKVSEKGVDEAIDELVIE